MRNANICPTIEQNDCAKVLNRTDCTLFETSHELEPMKPPYRKPHTQKKCYQNLLRRMIIAS